MLKWPVIISSFIMLIIAGNVDSQILTDETAAFAKAKELNCPVFLVFSGSDWCAPCIRFQKNILSDSAFMKFADENLILLKADFPQRNKLPPDLVSQNDKLAEKYNPEGLFPHLLLLNPGGTVISVINYNDQEPEEFIQLLENVIPAKVQMKEFRSSAQLMGCGFEFTVVDTADSDHGWNMIQKSIDEVGRIEDEISEWSDTTQIGRVNKLAGKEPVKVSPEVYGLIRRSIKISALTQGAFDITFGGVGKLWKFDRDNSVIPDSALVKEAMKTVGYQKIQMLDSDKVFLPAKGMKIGFGGVGKGFAAENVKKMVVADGITSGVINASGDLCAWGNRPDGTPWKVGIADPTDPGKILLWLPVTDAAVATSGNYEKYFEINGVRYSHIIDPRTGYPAKGIRSVTVISPSAELSDALATAVFVMGVGAGLDFIDQLPDTYCIIIDTNNKIHYSKDLEIDNLPHPLAPSPVGEGE